jgi:hypothetical protein
MITPVEEVEAALVSAAGRPWPVSRGDALRVIPGMMAIAGDGRRPWLAQRFSSLLTRP